MAAVASGEPAR